MFSLYYLPWSWWPFTAVKTLRHNPTLSHPQVCRRSELLQKRKLTSLVAEQRSWDLPNFLPLVQKAPERQFFWPVISVRVDLLAMQLHLSRPWSCKSVLTHTISIPNKHFLLHQHGPWYKCHIGLCRVPRKNRPVWVAPPPGKSYCSIYFKTCVYFKWVII